MLRKTGARVFVWAALLCLLRPGSVAAQDRDDKFNAESQIVEAARYYYQIEGDFESAKTRLEALVADSRNEEVLTQALFLLGKIYDESNDHSSALRDYKRALGGKGLQSAEKFWLYRRLLDLSPGSIQPMAVD